MTCECIQTVGIAWRNNSETISHENNAHIFFQRNKSTAQSLSITEAQSLTGRACRIVCDHVIQN
jgi:hypothetical protein